MNKKKTIATIIIGLVILLILVLLWIFVFRGIVSEILSNQEQADTATTTQDYIPSEKPLTVEEKKEVLDELLPENLVDTEEEIERREAQLEALSNMGGQSEQDRLDQLNGLGGGETTVEEREQQLQDLVNTNTPE